MRAAVTDCDNIWLKLKYILYLGRLLGLMPTLGIPHQLKFVRASSWTFSIILIGFSYTHLILRTRVMVTEVKEMSVADTALSFQAFVYFLTVAFFCSYTPFGCNFLEKLLNKWNSCNQQLKFKVSDTKLCLHANLIAIFVMIWGISENLLHDAHCINNYKTKDGGNAHPSWLEKLYMVGDDFWAVIVPYHWILASALFISHKISTYAWNYVDILIIVFCRALSFKFKALTLQLDVLQEATATTTEKLVSFVNTSSKKEKRAFSWDDVRSDFLILVELVGLVNSFCHPLVFLSYCTNIYSICLQLHDWITPHGTQDQIVTIYLSVSFFQFILRVLLITYFASNVNVFAQNIVHSIQQCPNSEYNLSVERLDRMFILQPVVIHGMGLFIITRKFLLSIIAFMFTLQIIMLQTMAPTPTP